MQPFVPKKSEKTVISLRIDVELLAQIERAAAQADISRNAWIVQCMAYVLENK